MQINFNQLSIYNIFKLSKHLKDNSSKHSSLEEVAQELSRMLYSSFVTEDGSSPFVLTRFFKTCTYSELPDDIRNYIHNKEPTRDLISDSKYLTLLGSYGVLDNWRNRNLSENYKAFPIHDEHMLDKFPMLSAVFKQIGFKLPHLKGAETSILLTDSHRQYGVFCVENAEDNKLIPKQAEFVKPYSVKSVFGFGGIYSTFNAYAVLVFARKRFSRKEAQLFLSLNPAIEQITLAQETTGNIFKAGRKDANASVGGLCNEIPKVQIESQNKTISPQHKDIIEKEMMLTSSIELEMANEYLLKLSKALEESHVKFEDIVRKRTHELSESKEQIQLLLNSTGEAIYGLDNDGKCTFANVACLRMLGYKEVSQFIGKNMHDLIHHTKKDGTPYPIEECCIYQVFREGKGTHIDDEVLWRADGTCFPAEYMSYPIYKDNKTIGAVVTFSDITERSRKDAELLMLKENLEQRVIERTELLRESEGRFRSLVENTTDWIWEANEHTRYTYASPQVRELLGYEPEEVIGMTPFDLMTPEDQQSVKKLFVEIAGRHEPFSRLENANLHKDGHTVILETSGVPIFGSDGSFKGYRGIDRDITERKKTEQALIQSEKLKSIGTITAGISHEFNNILAIISGNVQLLGRTYKDNENLTEALRTIRRAADDGAEISSKMLEFTKTVPDTKKFVSSDIRDLIRQSIDFTMPRWKNEAQARGIDYQMDTEGMKSVSSILCNPTELREVFINLIINALDAMPEGGSLSFSTWSGNDTVFVSISDTGEGMSEEVRKNVFDPFFTTKSPVGTGLGMSMAYGIITRHGGKIEAESELGKGTIFSLQIPIAAKVGDTELFSEPAQDIQCKSLHILVVDDEVNIGKLLDEFLSDDGHKVKTVDNGADAIKLLKRKSFDLVLCDLVMSDVSGYDIIKALNKLDRSPKIGIITGWNERLKPMEEGMNVDFVLRKPFDFSELSRKINDVIGVG